MFYLKIDVSRVNFQHVSQNATPAMEFARCHHLTQPCQCDSQETRNTTRLKCCACHTKWRWMSPKCCACHEKGKSSSENDATVRACYTERLLTRYETCWLEWHKVRHVPHETRLRDVWNLQKWPLLQHSPYRHGHSDLIANGCQRLHTVAKTKAASSEHDPTLRTPK